MPDVSSALVWLILMFFLKVFGFVPYFHSNGSRCSVPVLVKVAVSQPVCQPAVDVARGMQMDKNKM